MKTIYSLKEFHEKAVEICGNKPDHVSVSVEFGLFGVFDFVCYSDSKRVSGTTMEEALQRFHEKFNVKPVVTKNIDVEIEVEQ